METPLFSQVPNFVLKKHKPNHIPTYQIGEFDILTETEEPSPVKSTPKRRSQKAESTTENFPNEKSISIASTQELISTSDAAIQTVPTLLVNQGTQTEDSFVDYERHRALIEAKALSDKFKPMQLNNGEQAPLKVGLTIKGLSKKRKVFYPNLDEDEE